MSESTELIENHNIAAQLAKLKRLGYRLKIDDFGYNCIPLLLSPSIQFDALKLNMALIRHVPTSGIRKEGLFYFGKVIIIGVENLLGGIFIKHDKIESMDRDCAAACGYAGGLYIC